jgi:hypothetical protein
MTDGAAAGAAIAQAIKASGAIVRVESTDFMTILEKWIVLWWCAPRAGFSPRNITTLQAVKG